MEQDFVPFLNVVVDLDFKYYEDSRIKKSLVF